MPSVIGATQIEIDPSPGYVPAGATLSFGGILVKLAQPLQQGDTLIYATTPITGAIATGTTATYVTEPPVVLPYQQIFVGNAVGAGAVTVMSQPVVEQAVVVIEVVAAGAGGVAMSSALSIGVEAIGVGSVLATAGAGGGGYSDTIVAPLGSAGMTQLVGASEDDHCVNVGDIGFDFPFYDITFRTNIFVGSNGYVTFGSEYTLFSDLTRTSLGKALMICAADRSYQQVFANQDNPGQSFRIRYEGSSETTGTVGSPNMVWECTLFSDGTIQLATGTLIATDGVNSLTDGTGAYYTDYSIAENTSLVFQRQSPTNYTVASGSYTI